jgi:hypothetical protein
MTFTDLLMLKVYGNDTNDVIDAFIHVANAGTKSTDPTVVGLIDAWTNKSMVDPA